MGFAAFLHVSTVLISLDFSILFRHLIQQSDSMDGSSGVVRHSWLLCISKHWALSLVATSGSSSQKLRHSPFHICLIYNCRSKKMQPRCKHESAAEFTTGHWTGAGTAIIMIISEVSEEKLDKKFMKNNSLTQNAILVQCKSSSVTWIPLEPLRETDLSSIWPGLPYHRCLDPY